MPDRIAPCLWFDGCAEEAMTFYVDLFPNSVIERVNKSPLDWPGGIAGEAITVEATILGSPYVAMNGGPDCPFTQAISIQVYTDTQEETDRYWNALVADGGEELPCSWCRDRFGLHWQIVPRVLMEGIASTDLGVAERTFNAMFDMTKIDIKRIENAIEG